MIIFTCFAGRRGYLEILFKYIDELAVDEVHIWDYSRKESDAQYISNFESKYKIFHPKDKSTWTDYYTYYTPERYPDPDTVIIKSDDDIVFMNVDKFDSFIKHRIHDKNALILSASVVNNPVCGIIQRQLGIIPPSFGIEEVGNLTHNGLTVVKLHDYFLENPATFVSKSVAKNKQFVLPYDFKDIFNINFFAVLAKDLGLVYNIEYNNTEDERFIGHVASKYYRRPIVIDFDFTVVHMVYTNQRNAGFDEEKYTKYYLDVKNHQMVKKDVDVDQK